MTGRSSSSASLAVALYELMDYWHEHGRLAILEFCQNVLFPAMIGLMTLSIVGLAVQRFYRLVCPLGPAALHKEAIYLLLQLDTTTSAPTPLNPVQRTTTSGAIRHERRKQVLLKQAIAILRKASRPLSSKMKLEKILTRVNTNARGDCSNDNDAYFLYETDDVHLSGTCTYYAPAILSLAALYIYKLSDGKSAVALLESTLLSNTFTKTPIGGPKTVLPAPTTDGTTTQNENVSSTTFCFIVADAQSLLLDAQAVIAGHGNMIQTDLRQDEFLSLSYCESCGSNKNWDFSPIENNSNEKLRQTKGEILTSQKKQQ